MHCIVCLDNGPLPALCFHSMSTALEAFIGHKTIDPYSYLTGECV